MPDDDNGKDVPEAPAAAVVKAQQIFPCPFCGTSEETGIFNNAFDSEKDLREHIEDKHAEGMAKKKLEQTVPEFIKLLEEARKEGTFSSWVLITIDQKTGLRMNDSIRMSNSLEEMLCVEKILQLADENSHILSGRLPPQRQ
jgi:hypothetical protein